MAASFTLAVHPWSYQAKYGTDGKWTEEFVEKPHLTAEEEDNLDAAARDRLLTQRNSFPELPLINYTTQYGLGCFEGLKAMPQKDGSLKVFRPDENAARMKRSMEGLRMPGFPVDMFVNAAVELVRRNRDMGYTPSYNPAWEKTNFADGHAVYLRPFSYAEPGIGLGVSSYPWVVIAATNVGSYFDPESNSKAIVTDKLRATPGGTGWIKCNANYVQPILTKKQANEDGYMEAIFLDMTHTYVEEGSSCNIFFLMEDGTLVTPTLGDTILPGINRKSVLQLAADMGVPTEERAVPMAEVMDRAKECFVTGTAAGVSYIESVTWGETELVFNDRAIGELTEQLAVTLKGIQYGLVEDRHGWLFEV